MRIGERELHRLDLQMLAGDGIGRQRREVERSQDAECDLRGDALAVGRNLVDGRAAVIEGERRDPVERVRGEIGERVRRAVPLRIGDHGRCELAAVERVAVRRRDLFE